jgi:toxin-antitoxin system PIN domain toxin
VIVPDVNVLVYAADETSTHHAPARAWWEQTLSAATPVGLPWVVATGFLRVITNDRIFTTPFSPIEAMDVVEGWLQRSGVTVIGPGPRHAAVLRSFVAQQSRGGDTIPDCHIAAIASEHDAVLWSTNRGFSRYDGLRWKDPLAERPRE